MLVPVVNATVMQAALLGPDALILEMLASNARASYGDMAEAMGVNKQHVWRHVRLLEEDTIWGYGAVIDHLRLGWRRYLVTFDGLPDPEHIQRAEGQASPVHVDGRARVLHSRLVRGVDWSFQLDVVAQNRLALEQYLAMLQERLAVEVLPRVDEIEHVVRESGFLNPDRLGFGSFTSV